MHIEFLVEDSSGEKLLSALIPKIIGPQGNPHTWRLHGYKGIGRLPSGLAGGADPSKRILLANLPRILRGYGNTPGIDAVCVVLDGDRRDCREFLSELISVRDACHPAPNTLFRLAIEEMEAWYFGDSAALLGAYPRAKRQILDHYTQDAICHTWEKLAEAIHPGGSAVILKAGWPLPGQVKHTWAENIGPLMDPDQNISPSFNKFRDGLRRLVV